MTDKEKAGRYDSLQVAIRFEIDHLKAAAQSNRDFIKHDEDMTKLECFASGMARAYDEAVKILERWQDE